VQRVIWAEVLVSLDPKAVRLWFGTGSEAMVLQVERGLGNVAEGKEWRARQAGGWPVVFLENLVMGLKAAPGVSCGNEANWTKKQVISHCSLVTETKA